MGGGAVGPRPQGLPAAPMGGRMRRRAWGRALGTLSAAGLLAACATESVDLARQKELTSRAQECQRAHPEIDRWEVDRFGQVTAYYRMAGSATASTDPFFRCIFRR